MNRIAIVLLASVLALSTAAADHPECPDESDATVETPLGTYYVVADDCMVDDCLFSVWIYEENNGHPGLQRGGEYCEDGEICSPCENSVESDTIIF